MAQSDGRQQGQAVSRTAKTPSRSGDRPVAAETADPHDQDQACRAATPGNVEPVSV